MNNLILYTMCQSEQRFELDGAVLKKKIFHVLRFVCWALVLYDVNNKSLWVMRHKKNLQSYKRDHCEHFVVLRCDVGQKCCGACGMVQECFWVNCYHIQTSVRSVSKDHPSDHRSMVLAQMIIFMWAQEHGKYTSGDLPNQSCKYKQWYLYIDCLYKQV